MKKIWKDNAKLILAIFVTVVIASSATYAATIMYDSNIVGYDNSTSGLRSTNVQSALDELYGNIADVILNIKNLIGNSTLTTSEQTLTGAINELDDSMAKYYKGVVISSTIAPNVATTVQIPLPTGATEVLAYIPIGCSPQADNGTQAIIKYCNQANGSVEIYSLNYGGVVQKYAVWYVVIYR